MSLYEWSARWRCGGREMYRGQRWVLCPVYRTHNADAARGGGSAGRVALGRWRGLLASAPTRRAIYGIVQTQCNVSNGYFYAHASFFLAAFLVANGKSAMAAIGKRNTHRRVLVLFLILEFGQSAAHPARARYLMPTGAFDCTAHANSSTAGGSSSRWPESSAPR